MKRFPRLLVLLATLAPSLGLFAEPHHFQVRLADLEITSGEIPSGSRHWSHTWRNGVMMPNWQPYATSNAVETYLTHQPEPNQRRTVRNRYNPANLLLSVRADKLPVTGKLFLPRLEGEGFGEPVSFRITKKTPNADKPEIAFLRAKRNHYEQLLTLRHPGAARFRHQANSASAALRKLAVKADDVAEPNRRPFRPNRGRLEDTLDLFSGGRALSENLQFDREFRLAPEGNATVPIKDVQGITIEEMDWRDLLGDAKPDLDVLSRHLPADQHALFFPSFSDMLAVFDETALRTTPLLRLSENRAESARSKEKYQEQLCLPLSELSRLLGPSLIASVAMTGGDPFLRTGTDVAILYEAKQTEALVASLALRRLQTSEKRDDAQAVSGTVAGVDYVGLVSPDGSIRSYSATLGKNVVVVTNSLRQLRLIAETSAGKTPSLASLDEYAFFRSRYLLGTEEQAFLMVSDATIRRWCGPAWRIGASRRTRAAAALAELQARHEAGEKLRHSDFPELGKVSLKRGQVHSAKYGSLRFLTPVSELGIKKITPREKQAYLFFRNRYQDRWAAFFDPIAARLVVKDERIEADVTILPLIGGSDYRQLIETTGDVRLTPEAGDPHPETLAHWITALDMESRHMQQASNMAAIFAPALGLKAFGWVGEWASVYVDDSPFWKGFGEAVEKDGEDGAEDYLERNVPRLPVALNVEVTNPFKLTAFLAALRAWVEQVSPGMTAWTNHEHKKQGYVKIAPAGDTREELEEEGIEDIALYYAPSAKLLTVTLDEDLLKRAIDRSVEARRRRKENLPASPNPKPWKGESLALTVNHGLLRFFELATHDHLSREFRQRSWGNLPILNEWRLRLGKEDALAYHQDVWQVQLVCPGGGQYRWNEKFQTYESTLYGHPGEPKKPAAALPILRNFQRLDLGLTFEHDGLRARGAAWKRAPESGD